MGRWFEASLPLSLTSSPFPSLLPLPPPPPPKAWNLLGLARTSMGDIREGVKAYERAVALRPDYREAWVNMGQALKEEGRTREAEAALTRVRRGWGVCVGVGGGEGGGAAAVGSALLLGEEGRTWEAEAAPTRVREGGSVCGGGGWVGVVVGGGGAQLLAAGCWEGGERLVARGEEAALIRVRRRWGAVVSVGRGRMLARGGVGVHWVGHAAC